MSFRLVPKSVTLDDLERRNGRYSALFHRIFVYDVVAKQLSGLPRFQNLLFMVALWNRADHYIFALWFLSFFFLSSFFLLFYSSPNLSSRRLDVYHTATHGANLECRSKICCTRLAGNAGCKNRQKFSVWAPSHNIVGLYLRN